MNKHLELNPYKQNIFFFFLLMGFAQNISAANEIPSFKPQIEFTENKGQWNEDIQFRFFSSSLDIHLKKNGINYYLFDEKDIAEIFKHPSSEKPKITSAKSHFIQLNFIGANSNIEISKQKKSAHYYNYFLGSERNKWKSRIYAYQDILYSNIYEGIDLKISSSGDELKYDWILKPNADPTKIKMNFEGATNLKSEYGDLFIYHSLGFMRERKPIAYQIIDGKHVDLLVEFVILGKNVSFNLLEGYNKNYELIIDPQLVFSTYSGSRVDNFGFTATYDSQGHLYTGGIGSSHALGNNFDTSGYPTTPGAFQKYFKNGSAMPPVNLPCDITISKYSADGKNLLYATYFGGSGNEHPHSLVVDKDDNFIFFGTTNSYDFPTTINGYDTTANGSFDLFVAKFDSACNGLIASTYLGGSYNDGLNNIDEGTGGLHHFYADDFRGDIIPDKSGNILLATVSQSVDFPVTNGSFGGAITQGQKGVVLKFSPNLDSLIFSGSIGGKSGNEAIYSIDLNSNEDIYIAGGTSSVDSFPGITNTYFGGISDGFITKIKNDGSQILKSLYFGTNKYDQIYSLELDKSENVFIVGQSLGNIAVSPTVYNNPGTHHFIASLDKNLNATIFSTVFGGSKNNLNITINAFLVDDCGRIYVAGWGASDFTPASGTTDSLPVTTDAYKKTTDGRDFYLLVLGKNAENLLYASFFGGTNSSDHVDGGTSRFDKKGVVYQSVCASCQNPGPPLSDFPTTAGVKFPQNLSPRCSNAGFKFDFKIPNADFDFAIDTCADIINFASKTPDADGYLWIFPDGQTTTEKNPVMVLSKLVNKEVMLITNPGSLCSDTIKKLIIFNDTIVFPFVPNVFSPNNDGVNDFYFFYGLKRRCDKAEIKIYNRWGQLYFEASQTDFTWDGTDGKGSLAPVGVYFYIGMFKQMGKPEVKLHGTITLLR